ncbi:MAG TPA: DUF4332 domain-containing protein [Myxococcales bacterium]|nr:DUF4332 domain-containing protein [Myxococcales bacterium]
MAELTRPRGFPSGMEVAASGYARGHARPRGKGWAAVAVGVGLLAGSTQLMLRGVEPFATSFYLFAWYSTLLALYGALALSAGRSPRLRRPTSLLTMLAWSAVLWLFFELVNLRLRNWYYVFVPASPWVRWPCIILSFATVLPAVFGAEAMLEARDVFEEKRWPRLRVTPRLLTGMQVAGALMFLLPMAWPRYFFPLVWGTTTFMLEPAVYRRDRSRSLLADLEEGRPARLLRLLAGGAAIGFLWELFNIAARGKWIYTVPFFEEAKLFEMPVLGFLGFPPFAVDCFVVWQLLVLAGVAVGLDGRARPGSGLRRLGAFVVAAVFTALVAVGMEDRTISSVRPLIEGVPGVPAAQLSAAGYADPFVLARASVPDVAERTGALPAAAAAWIEEARLVALRGIGDGNASLLARVGVTNVPTLAAQDPALLAQRLRAAGAGEVLDARVRVWVRAARKAVGGPPLQATTSRLPAGSAAAGARTSPMTAAAGV